MKRILVGIKRVVGHDVRVRVKPDNTGVVTEGVRFAINPFDEIALEEALRLREGGVADEVVVVSVGPAEAQNQLRTALAMGADRALLVATTAVVEPPDVARLLLKLVERERPLLVLLGKQAIDDDNGQVGQMLAALWDRPQATFASQVEMLGDALRVTREVDAGLELVEVDLPAVVTVDLRLNEPRYVKLPEIIKARKKPLETIDPAVLGVVPRERVRTLRHDVPAARARGVRLQDVAQLVAALESRGLV